MQLEICPGCQETLDPQRRARCCSPRCRFRDWKHQQVAKARAALRLPTATLSAEDEARIPAGPEQHWMRLQMLLHARAPAGSKGYRVGIMRRGSQTMRWFPSMVGRTVPAFALIPFETPVVPMPGLYAVVYVDGLGQPIGEPRFTLSIPYGNRQLRLSDGDRTLKPRLVK